MRVSRRSRTVLVTAFTPFGGRRTNASLLALRCLRRDLPWLRTRVLPVDSALAPLRLRRALREVSPAALVMLGEAGGSAALRLETTAWNLLDFRIPDAAGRQPIGVPIRPGGPEFHRATLPLDRLHDALLALGHSVSRSDDPGRYLCNQLMFEALDHIARRDAPCQAGFVHLPLETELPTPRAVAALARLVSLLRE